MAGARLSKFSRKYGFFLSDATNEEIVSISKELSDEMAHQIKSLNVSALALMGISSISLLLSILLISQSTESVATNVKLVLFFLRSAAIVLMVLSALIAFLAVSLAQDANAVSPLMWKNIRETADDEKAYEQMATIKYLNKLVFRARNEVKASALVMALGGLLLGVAFIIQLFSSAGYI